MFCESFKELGGSSLLGIHNSSLYKVLSSVYPEYEWLPWKFSKSPKFSKDSAKFVEMAGDELGIKEMNDWYKIKKEQIKAVKGGEEFLQGFKRFSLCHLLNSVYPEKLWLPWRFEQYSSDADSNKKFMEMAGKELGIKEMSDWYAVKAEVQGE